mmetsp:Transcript_17366/g.42123  ORF Transcript_17366/g.42123 Transcript_17366/m.42123 type:complete len:215 (+) Transcript_17366:283-927(+)
MPCAHCASTFLARPSTCSSSSSTFFTTSVASSWMCWPSPHMSSILAPALTPTPAKSSSLPRSFPLKIRRCSFSATREIRSSFFFRPPNVSPSSSTNRNRVFPRETVTRLAPSASAPSSLTMVTEGPALAGPTPPSPPPSLWFSLSFCASAASCARFCLASFSSCAFNSLCPASESISITLSPLFIPEAATQSPSLRSLPLKISFWAGGETPVTS